MLAQSIEKEAAIGPTRSIKTPGEAAKVATDGAVIILDDAVYPGGIALWPQSDITILGAGERPHIRADGKSVNGRDIWLITGNNVVVENIEFSGARSLKYRNGAGIRHTGSTLVIRHGFFHDNDNGILTWKAPDGEILIEFSEFARNEYGDGLSHNVYIGTARRLTFRYNYSHSVNIGHLLKSRARTNDVRYNRFTGEHGQVSYLIDLPNGGIAYIIGNEIEKAVESRNPHVISFGEEGLTSDDNGLFVVHNSVYNRFDSAIFVRNSSKTRALIANNLFGGAPLGLVSGSHVESGNQAFPDHGMVDPREYDFLLTSSAEAIDSGVSIDADLAILPLVPEAEYVHPVSMQRRISVADIDVGGHEFCSK